MEALNYLGKSCLQKADFPSRLRQKFAKHLACPLTFHWKRIYINIQFSRLTFLSQIISRGLSELGRGKVRSIAAISSLVSLEFPTSLLISLTWSGLPAFGIVKRAG